MRRPWVLPLVPLYAAGSALRWIGVKPKRLAWPVVSVGNLSTGGAGKTPFTIELARLLVQAGVHVDVLSRGYGRTGKEVEQVDPAGAAERFGDEPILIARESGVPVYVGASRFAAGALAETEAAGLHQAGSRQAGSRQAGSRPARVHLLDDGFQHRQLARDVDIVLLNSEDLEDHSLPAGNLREGLSALRRATIFAVPSADDRAVSSVRRLGFEQPIWRFRREMELPAASGQVIAFCGIARPEQFFAGIERAGIAISARHAFRDHHRFTPADVVRLHAMAAKTGAAAFVTTEKDLVRLGDLAAELRQAAPVVTAGLRVTIEDRAAICVSLLEQLRAIRADSAL